MFTLFRHYYVRILSWALANKLLFLSIPTLIVIFGITIMSNTGKEFMPALNEEELIKESIDSIFCSDYPFNRFEVICINDGSRFRVVDGH